MNKHERSEWILNALCPAQVFPLHKVKKLIKAEGDVKAISGEGSFAIARVTVC